MMKIENLFSKKINRPISGVIKIGNGEENRHQELEDYVVTKELNKYFAQFFDAFSQTNESSQKETRLKILLLLRIWKNQQKCQQM